MIKMNEILMEPCIRTQFVQYSRKNLKGKLNEYVHNKIGFIICMKAATRRDSNIALIQEKMVKIRAIQGHTGGVTIKPELMNHVLIPKIWKNLSPTEVLRTTNILLHEQDSWQEESKVKKDDKPFTSRLLIHSEVMHMKKKDRVKIIHNQGKSIVIAIGENDQNAVYWVKINEKAQDLGLQIGQQNQTPLSCINQCQISPRVVSDNGDRILFQRILTPRPKPKVTVRDTWRSKQQHNEQQQQPQSWESDLGPGRPVQSGDRNESRNKGNDMASDSLSSRGPVQAENEVIQSSEIDLRVNGISQEEIYSDEQFMDEVKKQLEELQEESKSKNIY